MEKPLLYHQSWSPFPSNPQECVWKSPLNAGSSNRAAWSFGVWEEYSPGCLGRSSKVVMD
eukprot:2138643-Ditylum_brightwellii.AAC.1